MSGEPVKRRYDATTRQAAAARTRDQICAAAEELFVRDGYARTSIKAVARAAGVSEATVYLAFEGKPGLLNAVILRAVQDDEAESIDTVLSGSAADVIPRLARSNALTMERAAHVIALGEGAALMDAELRGMQARAHARLLASWARVAERLDEAGLLADDAETAARTIFAVSSETAYLRMTDDVGLSVDAYAAWLETTLARLLLR
ncbi:MAG: TetR/AcrR family transcriptional regulator [Solirubrobacteraceae bacterium]|nr:TetR/AcrR family transcriptional regulator [Solirubrobacteraceae bacterium]